MSADRPILALDIDGVISLFGFEGSPNDAPGRFHLINGIAHCIPEDVGARPLRTSWLMVGTRRGLLPVT